MCNAAWLSQNKTTGREIRVCKSASRDNIQMNSHVALAMDLYSASVEDLDTLCCFLDFQEIKELPSITQKPDMDLRVSGHAAQSESENKFSKRDLKAVANSGKKFFQKAKTRRLALHELGKHRTQLHTG